MTPVESARGTGAGTSRRLRERLIRYGRIVGGTCLTAVGVLLLILPGPGIPLLLAGFLLLEREIEWARPLRLEIMRRLRSIGSAARRIATCALHRGTSPGGPRVKARPPHAPPRPPPPQEPLVSWRHWRRALAISIEAGLTKAERRELLTRLARVRRGDEPPRASPRLRLVRGGERRTAASPLPGAPWLEGRSMRTKLETARKVAAALGLAAVLIAPARPAGAAEWVAEVETGLAWATRNDVRIPGAGGTGLSLVRDLDAGAAPVFRARVGAPLTNRHWLALAWAPVRLEARGALPGNVRFAGEDFAAGSSVLARYRFDSYRFSYRYALVRSSPLDLELGATAFVRDAAISLQGARYAEKANVGFVPLLSVRLEWRLSPPVSFLLDGDALAARQGRAEDVLVALRAQVRPGVHLHAGYRIIEGGADNAEVYNFALVNQLVVGLTVSL